MEVWGNRFAFLAQLRSGKVVAWGHRDYGGDISGVKAELEHGIAMMSWHGNLQPRAELFFFLLLLFLLLPTGCGVVEGRLCLAAAAAAGFSTHNY